MSIDETVLAEAAVTALSGPRYCEFNDELLDPVTGQCGFGDHTHCPFCGAAGGEDCPHMVAEWNSEQGYEGPRLPMPPARAELLGEFSKEQQQQVLGDFLGLSEVYAEYAEGASYPVGSYRYIMGENWLSNQLLEWVIARVPGIRVVSWDPSGPGGANGDVCYAARPDQVRAEMEALTDRVVRAFETLLSAGS